MGSAWARSAWNQEEEGRLGCFRECSGFPFSSELLSGNGRGLGSAEGRSGLPAVHFLGEKGQPRVGSDHWCSVLLAAQPLGCWGLGGNVDMAQPRDVLSTHAVQPHLRLQPPPRLKCGEKLAVSLDQLSPE